jgi:hypothetical protein
VPIRVPVRRDGAADQVVTVLLSAAVFDRLFREAGIPGRWIASVIDPSHRVAGRNRASGTYAGQTVSAALRDRLNRGDTGLAAPRRSTAPRSTAYGAAPAPRDGPSWSARRWRRSKGRRGAKRS